MVAGLTAFLFVLQLLVPAGFMPDLKAAAKGTFQIVVCNGTGLQTITVDATGKPVNPDDPANSKSGGANTCPFFKVASKAAVLVAGPSVQDLPVLAGPAFDLVRFDTPAVPRVGGFLGSRAPPVSLG